MKKALRFSIVGSTLVLVGSWAIPALAQDQSASQGQSSAAQRSDQKQDTSKKKISEKQVLKELATPYKKWLSEDVIYIITYTHRRTFSQLLTTHVRKNSTI